LILSNIIGGDMVEELKELIKDKEKIKFIRKN
jgi:hypothetical protein